MLEHVVHRRVWVIGVVLGSSFDPIGVSKGVLDLGHQFAGNGGICLLVVRHVVLVSYPLDGGSAFLKRRIRPFEMKQHPEFETGDRNGLLDRQGILLADRQGLDSVSRTIEALMAVAVEDTENLIVAAALGTFSLGAFDDADRCRPDRVVGKDDFCRGQPVFDTRRFEINLLGFAFAHDERDGTWQLLLTPAQQRTLLSKF